MKMLNSSLYYSPTPKVRFKPRTSSICLYVTSPSSQIIMLGDNDNISTDSFSTKANARAGIATGYGLDSRVSIPGRGK
jgi:hypothetical protein